MVWCPSPTGRLFLPVVVTSSGRWNKSTQSCRGVVSRTGNAVWHEGRMPSGGKQAALVLPRGPMSEGLGKNVFRVNDRLQNTIRWGIEPGRSTSAVYHTHRPTS